MILTMSTNNLNLIANHLTLGAGPGFTGIGGVPGAGGLFPGAGGEIKLCAVLLNDSHFIRMIHH